MHVDVQELSVPRPRNIMLALLAVTIYIPHANCGYGHHQLCIYIADDHIHSQYMQREYRNIYIERERNT